MRLCKRLLIFNDDYKRSENRSPHHNDDDVPENRSRLVSSLKCRINMYVVDVNGRKKRHVVGLAPVSGMCNSLNSCTISEGTSFQTVLVAAHEMGHRSVKRQRPSVDQPFITDDAFLFPFP